MPAARDEYRARPDRCPHRRLAQKCSRPGRCRRDCILRRWSRPSPAQGARPGRQDRELAQKGKGLAFLHYSIDPPEAYRRTCAGGWAGCYQVGLSQTPSTREGDAGPERPPDQPGLRRATLPRTSGIRYRLSANDPNVVPIMTGRLPPRDPQDKVLAWAYSAATAAGIRLLRGHTDRNWHHGAVPQDVPQSSSGGPRPRCRGRRSSVQPWRFVSIPGFTGADLSYPQSGWEETLDYVLKAVKAENPEFVLVPGDLVAGQWPDKESIEKQAAVYYPAWVKRMQDTAWRSTPRSATMRSGAARGRRRRRTSCVCSSGSSKAPAMPLSGRFA